MSKKDVLIREVKAMHTKVRVFMSEGHSEEVAKQLAKDWINEVRRNKTARRKGSK